MPQKCAYNSAMSTTRKSRLAILGFATLLAISIAPNSAHSEEIPMTINGEINCAHPANAITTTCKGETPPPPVNTPIAAAPSQTDSAPSSEPMTINGEINCANPNNSITTTCWDKGSAAIDCTKAQFKEFPVCTGIKPEAVITLEETKANAAPVPMTDTNTVKIVTIKKPAPKKIKSITCVKGKSVKVVKGTSPKCPSGYKLKA